MSTRLICTDHRKFSIAITIIALSMLLVTTAFTTQATESFDISARGQQHNDLDAQLETALRRAGFTADRQAPGRPGQEALL
jgi:hypothetical protein